jgi:hypothetical protein
VANKTAERARLLELYRETGDEDYRCAAECLTIRLLDFLNDRPRRRGGRGQGRAGKVAIERLARMHRLIAAGTSPHSAATQEVAQHGHGEHASTEAAVTYLRRAYARERVCFESIDRIQQYRASVSKLVRHARSAAELLHTARQTTPRPFLLRTFDWFHGASRWINHRLKNRPF